MVIETERKLTKAEAKEVTNMLYNIRKLIKNPTGKLKDMFRFCAGGAIFCVLSLLLFFFFFARGDRDALTLTGLFITVIAGLLVAVFYVSIHKTYRTLLDKDSGKVTVTLDEKGIVYEVQGSTRMETAWANVAFGRAFREMVGFFPKDITGILFTVSKEYYDEMRKYIEENHIDVRFVEE